MLLLLHEQYLCKQCSDVVYCAIEGRKKLNRICVHCVDDFLARENRRLDMVTASRTSLGSDYTGSTSGSQRFGQPRPPADSTGRRESGLSNSNSNSSTAGSESPTSAAAAAAVGGMSMATSALDDAIRREAASRKHARRAKAAATTSSNVDLSYLTHF